jgi:RNA polymerase sigma factor (sigma-70 family)
LGFIAKAFEKRKGYYPFDLEIIYQKKSYESILFSNCFTKESFMKYLHKNKPKSESFPKHLIIPCIKSDQEIWIDFLNGSESAIAYLYSKFVPVLFNYGMQIIQNDDMVSDCIQDLFFDLIDKRNKLAHAKSVKCYLIASLRRRILRQISRDKKLTLEQNLENIGFNYKMDLDLIQVFNNHSIGKNQILEKACNALPKRQREAIMLFFFEELSYKQIAEVFNFSHPKNARTLVYRALHTLSEKLSSFKNEFLVIVFSILIP